MNAARVGMLHLDAAKLLSEIETLLALGTHPCADGVGEWAFSHLWYGDAARERDTSSDVRRSLPYIDRRIEETFRTDRVTMVRVFAATRGGYVRPHRDWTGSTPAFTRFHVPLQTGDACFNSEDDIVYHMDTGEIWFLDGGRPHSGVCFSDTPRLHLVVDFEPGIPLGDLFRDPSAYRKPPPFRPVERPPLTELDLTAIFDLAHIVTTANFELVADLLGTIHFEKHVSCAAMYDWLIEIARRSGDRELADRSAELKRSYIGAGSTV
jgi:L-proline cis-4-hydroxylase